MPETTPEKLVRDHLLIARQEARRWKHVLALEQEDLVSEGALALVKAARDFDPNRGVLFGSYARIRVRGAVVDAVRANARRNRLDDDTYAAVVSLDDPDVLERPGREDVVATVISLERLRSLRKLPERERNVLVRQALGDTLEEIALDLGVGESRVCQLAARGAARLRKAA